LSFKNLTVVDRKVNNDYNLTLRERRLGYEIQASNEILRENLQTLQKMLFYLKNILKMDTHKKLKI